MSLVVLSGGARSGKSRVAQKLGEQCPEPMTVVVFGQEGGDAEMERRIRMHKEQRPAEWATVEAADSVEWTDRVGDAPLLIDCLGTLVGMVMGEVYAEMAADSFADATILPEGYEPEVERRVAALLGWIVRRFDRTIVVTNEVGDGIVPIHATGRVFRDVLGRANRSLVDRADAAYLVVAGRCIDLARLPREIRWPGPKGCA